MAITYQDRLKNTFKIVTGKGTKNEKPWYPLLIPTYQKNVEYNGQQYEFVNTIGSLFVRRLPKGTVYSLEFAFTGEDNDRLANSFEVATREAVPWRVTHPLYGEFVCQPLNLESNNTGLMTTIVKAQVVETLIQGTSENLYAPTESIYQKSQLVRTDSLEFLKARNGFAGKVTSKETTSISIQTTKISKIAETVAKTESSYKSYKAFLNKATTEINNATGFSAALLTAIQGIVNTPAIVASDIGTRINCVEGCLSTLYNSIVGMASLSYIQKLFYNLVGVTCLTTYCDVLQSPKPGDLQTKKEILFYSDKLSRAYNLYLTGLYGLQDKNFTPDHDLLFSLHGLIHQTTFSLYSVLSSAKQERIFYCDTDTNLIVLAYQLYGNASDDNINLIKSINQIGLSEILNIKKGRAITYLI